MGARARTPIATALVLQHGESGPPALLADWASARGIRLQIHRTDRGAAMPEPGDHAFVASLGSRHCPADMHVPEVVADLDFMGRVVKRGTPVLGLCYGAQVLAKVLGGEVENAPEPELGWHRIDSADPEAIPEGPWLQWHYHRFTVPQGGREIARSSVGPQAFTLGRHLGVQFHPESTIEIVQEWARLDAERLAGLGIDDGPALVERGREHAAPARAAACDLFDAFWARART
jgi:GMP synthase-like glutamine amidotransferase